ncbi:MAG: sulfatase-like hydrolase/transferase [Myxococcota bacterium]
MRGFATRFAAAVGALAIGAVLVVSLAVALRLAQVRFFRSPAKPERAAEKAAYLERVAQAASGRDASALPSFVVVFFDDLGYGDLGSYGNRLIATPRLDALADQGLRMTQFYAAAPVCTPSRAALLTGRFPFRAGAGPHVYFPNDAPLGLALGFFGFPNEVRSDEIFLPEALRAAGYATGMVGKWHLGDADGHRPNDLGFDSYYGVLWSHDMQPLDVYRDRDVVVRDETEQSWLHAFRDEEDAREFRGIDPRTFTDDYTREAIRFLERSQADGPRPFFLYLAHSAPHVPHFASRAQAGRSRGGVYGDVVEDLDRSTGELVDALDRLGLSERTLVLVTSDNGADYGGSPGALRGRKGEVLEGGMRVPMIARWPGRVASGTSDAIAMNLDVFPTLLGLAGVPLPDDRVVDGRDLAPVLLANAPSPHEFLYYLGGAASGSHVAAVRDARFKYLLESGDRGRSRPHLTSLALDAEAHDLRARHPEEAARLAQAAARLQAELDANPRGFRE